MLDAGLKSQLQAYLEKLVRPIEINANADSSAKSREMVELLEEITALSDKITLHVAYDPALRVPSFALASPGHDIDLRFAGIPLGHEFTSLVLALLQAGGHPPRVERQSSNRCAGSTATFISRLISRSPARIAPTSFRR